MPLWLRRPGQKLPTKMRLGMSRQKKYIKDFQKKPEFQKTTHGGIKDPKNRGVGLSQYFAKFQKKFGQEKPNFALKVQICLRFWSHMAII